MTGGKSSRQINLVLVFVRHENEMGRVPDVVKTGFNGPEEGGFAPNMAVVTADCSKFVCEIPYGGKESNGAVREQIFRRKIAVIKKFLAAQPNRHRAWLNKSSQSLLSPSRRREAAVAEIRTGVGQASRLTLNCRFRSCPIITMRQNGIQHYAKQPQENEGCHSSQMVPTLQDC